MATDAKIFYLKELFTRSSMTSTALGNPRVSTKCQDISFWGIRYGSVSHQCRAAQFWQQVCVRLSGVEKVNSIMSPMSCQCQQWSIQRPSMCGFAFHPRKCALSQFCPKTLPLIMSGIKTSCKSNSSQWSWSNLVMIHAFPSIMAHHFTRKGDNEVVRRSLHLNFGSLAWQLPGF